ncbi:MAG: acetylornithine/succinylornithine family transaminase [Candidatus Rokubacteria bacterium]|nr:acetylornithine/succinylornithine family transaminase [Candidatus Rokubacteria bacterium]
MLDEPSLLAGVILHPRLILERGKGSRVWDREGREYLDFTAGLGCAALGHGRRDLASILARQFATLGHTSNLYGNTPALELADRLVRSSFASRIWFANSGTEANEAAIKFARLHGARTGGTRKRVLVAFRGGFHGRTCGALAVTHHPAYRRPFGPLLPGVRFGDFNDAEGAAALVDDRACAVIVEPVQGEGGVVPAEAAFLRRLREICDARDALLIFDEVQCGLGRTGSLHAYQGYGVTPDMLTLAKPLAAGLPLGALLIGEKVAGFLRPGQHGSTFSGGPAVCAVARRVFDRLSAPDFLVRVRERGALLMEGLVEAAGASPIFEGVRGRGLMQALVLSSPRRHAPDRFVALAREHGLLVTRAGPDAVRLLPPLSCTPAEIREALGVIRAVALEMERAERKARAPVRSKREPERPARKGSRAGAAALAAAGGRG